MNPHTEENIFSINTTEQRKNTISADSIPRLIFFNVKFVIAKVLPEDTKIKTQDSICRSAEPNDVLTPLEILAKSYFSFRDICSVRGDPVCSSVHLRVPWLFKLNNVG